MRFCNLLILLDTKIPSRIDWVFFLVALGFKALRELFLVSPQIDVVDEFTAFSDLGLVVDVANMGIDRMGGYDQLLSDRVRGFAARDEPEDFPFAFR